MTDTKALVERLRAVDEEALNTAPWSCEQLMREAADALEALSRPAGEGEWRSMTPWEGGDYAPEDWDGGPVLLRNGSWLPEDWQVLRWDHTRVYRDTDIVFYTARG